MVTPDATCSAAARAAGEPLRGTAASATAYLLIEHAGPWGPKILKDVDFGPSTEQLRSQLAGLPAGVTPLLIRRHNSPHSIPSPLVVSAVALTPHGGRGITTQLDDVSQVATWNLRALISAASAALGPGAATPGVRWQPLPPTVLVCTHGKRDQCCAVLGRPLAQTLLAPARAAGVEVWECSHIGGHRLAASAITLPIGLVFGQLEPGAAPTLLDCLTGGVVWTERLRGRACLAPAVQAAEIAVRERVGGPFTDEDAVALLSIGAPALDDDGAAHPPLTTSRWQVRTPSGLEVWQAHVLTTRPGGKPLPESCGKDPVPPPARQELRGLERIS